jgi:hypothetical protein
MAGNVGNDSVDDDPEYGTDAVADIDAEAFGFEPTDPAQMPKPQGDAGERGLYPGKPGASGGDV